MKKKIKEFTKIEAEYSLKYLLVLKKYDNVGVYVLQKQGEIILIYGFRCSGLDPFRRDNDYYDQHFAAIFNGLKAFTGQERMTFFQRNKPASAQEIDATSKEASFLRREEKRKVLALNEKGIRRERQLEIYITKTLNRKKQKKWFSNLIDFAEKKVLRLENEQMRQLLVKYAEPNLMYYYRLLNNQFQLNCVPLSFVDMWKNVWSFFDEKKPMEANNLLVLGKDLVRQGSSQYSLLNSILRQELPIAHRSFVKFGQLYKGILHLLDKPIGWNNRTEQLKTMSAFLNNPVFKEATIITQIRETSLTSLSNAQEDLIKRARTKIIEDRKQGLSGIKSELLLEEANQSLRSLFQNEKPYYLSTSILITQPSLAKLEQVKEEIQSSWPGPSYFYYNDNWAWKAILDTAPWAAEDLIKKPFDIREKYLASEVPGFVPWLKITPIDTKGVEFISTNTGEPIYLDICNKHKNMLFFGTTRCGKSVLASNFLNEARSKNIPIVALDYPKPDGTSTFSEVINYWDGSYLDISKESFNIFELSTDRNKISAEQFREYKAFLLEVLMVMVLGSEYDKVDENDIYRAILGSILTVFFAEEKIKKQYQEKKYPNLLDFITYCRGEFIKLSNEEPTMEQKLNKIRLKLNYFVTTKVGKALTTSSSIKKDAKFLVIGLTNLSDRDEATLIALTAYGIMLSRILDSDKSVIFFDESPILLGYKSIAMLVGRLCANGAKSGVRVLLAAQDLASIKNCSNSSQILENIKYKLIGKIEAIAVNSFTELGIDRSLLEEAINFSTNRAQGFSNWLINYESSVLKTAYYPNRAILNLTGNNPEETRRREELKKSTKLDKYEQLQQKL